MGQIIIKGQVVIPGQASGRALVSKEPISFWGGYDWASGEIIDCRHELSGKIASGRILAIPFTRGSSTTTAVLLEAIRNETAPAAIITTGIDFFFALASVVADVLYAKPIPIIALEQADFIILQNDDDIEISTDGMIKISREDKLIS